MNQIDGIVIPEPPFIWPEITVSHKTQHPFHNLVGKSTSAFGIISALNYDGIKVIGDCFAKYEKFIARFILAVYPTCFTSQDDLHRLQQLANSFSPRLIIRIKPYRKVTDRPTNAICFIKKDPDVTYLLTGPTENLGYDQNYDGKVNFIFRSDPVLTKFFSNYFTYIWVQSRNILTGIPEMPELVLPDGSAKATQMWINFCNACSPADPADNAETVQIDPQTGEIQLISSEGKAISSPGEEVGLPKVDYLTEKIARLYEKGMLVSIDKHSRIPPLDAPLNPAWFGDSAEMQHGIITRKLSMRVSIIDEKTLNGIDKYRKKMRDLLNRFSFPLADNMRWLPYTAKELFENEIARINEDGQKLINSFLKGDPSSFVQNKKEMLKNNINNMYRELGKKGEVADNVINKVIDDLTKRISKAQSANLLPKLTYSNIAFNTATNTWATPWGQAFSLLSGIAAFPRKALSDPFFFCGLRVAEEELIDVMNVADDVLIRDMAKSGSTMIKERCKSELAFLTSIEKSILEPRNKCALVYRLINGEKLSILNLLLAEAEEQKENKLK